MIKSDRWIRRMAQEHDMINPYSEKQVSEGVISCSVSSYGYDLRVADEFKIFTNVNRTIVDPNHFDERSFVTVNAGRDRPVEFVCAGASVEYFKIPRDVLTICVDKSIYARCGIIVNVTPFEPEWEGFVALEISNTTPLPAKIYAKRMPLPNSLLPVGRICETSYQVCETSYKDRKRKYQAQKGIVLPKLQGGIQHSAVSSQLSVRLWATRWFGRRRVPREPCQDSPFEFLWSGLVRSSVNGAGHLPNDYLGRVFRLDHV
jgi:dCTP deaminase